MDMESSAVEDGDKSETNCLKKTSEEQQQSMEVDNLKEQQQEEMSQNDSTNCERNSQVDGEEQNISPQNEVSNQFLNTMPGSRNEAQHKNDYSVDTHSSGVKRECSTEETEMPSETTAPNTVLTTSKS